MKALSPPQILEVSGGLKIHFNMNEVLFTTLCATLTGGFASAGMIIAGAIASQGVGNLRDLTLGDPFIVQLVNCVDHWVHTENVRTVSR